MAPGHHGLEAWTFSPTPASGRKEDLVIKLTIVYASDKTSRRPQQHGVQMASGVVTTRGSPAPGDRSRGLQTLGTRPQASHPVHLCPSPGPAPQKEPGNARSASVSSAGPASKLVEAESGVGTCISNKPDRRCGPLGDALLVTSF